MLTTYTGTPKGGTLERTIAPGEEPISLSETKRFMRIDGPHADDVLSHMIVAAREAAEQHLRRSLNMQSWTLWFDDYAPTTVFMPMGPVASITQISAINRSGVETVLPASTYSLSAGKDVLRFDAVALGHYVEILYVAGFGDAEDVPASIKQAMLQHVAALYEGRDGGAMPELSRLLYAPWRVTNL